MKHEEYAKKVLPFVKSEYFRNEGERVLFNEIESFIHKYNVPPTIDALKVEIDSIKGVDTDKILGLIDILHKDEIDTNLDWLIDATEKFCKHEAVYNAIVESMEIMDNKGSGFKDKGAIPGILTNALAVSFDPHVGHDYLEQYDDRFEYYHRVLEKSPFDLEFFNKITNDGVAKKTLNVALAGTGVGKSLFMCHVAASCLNLGKHVLYITLELSEDEVGKRVDANLMNIAIDDLLKLSKDMYDIRAARIKSKTNGKLIIKEYPTAGASVSHFKALINELYLKKNFKPDIIFVDYINICLSSRIRQGSGVNSYTYIKAIAEELRGLAVEFDVPMVSATQTNRGGFDSSDPSMTDTSESFGLPMTADFMFALISNEELDKLNQIMVKQLKNRYNDLTKNKRFVIGIDRAKMKLYDVEANAQINISDSGQTQTKSPKDKFKTLKVS